ncbi:MAG: hypothetical protein ACK5HL_03935 [Bacilli bacterium]
MAFLGLHGSIREDGRLQALLDLNNIKYTGSNYRGSLLAMDKYLSKLIATNNSVPTPKLEIYKENKEEIINKIGFPMVIKTNILKVALLKFVLLKLMKIFQKRCVIMD